MSSAQLTIFAYSTTNIVKRTHTFKYYIRMHMHFGQPKGGGGGKWMKVLRFFFNWTRSGYEKCGEELQSAGNKETFESWISLKVRL